MYVKIRGNAVLCLFKNESFSKQKFHRDDLEITDG